MDFLYFILHSCFCESISKLRVSYNFVRLISEVLRVQIVSCTPNTVTNYFHVFSIKEPFDICVISLNLYFYRRPWKILLHV